ncbi:ribosomal RNA processing protein 36 homolog [Stomoxys calcitrans]|uniref:ribosomal RNA processing protein 36 homolog n=1 Tax=Stomoxys calcitrans TaxID=35570 RepID=UPI0027E2F1E6|nr:ribosomal RNA processing protein 36 homolog [Stomoxys calcitrans]
MISSSEDHSSSDDDDEQQRNEIREDLKSMSFEEIMKLKEELGSKIYKEAVLGIENRSKNAKLKKDKQDFKRLNKNRPREQTSTRQVPFLGAEMRLKRKKDHDIRDPRFDERAGDYDVKKFKENYKFVSEIREKEVQHLKSALNKATDDEERQDIKKTIQRLINKNVEENKWHQKQQQLKEEQKEVQKAIAEGRQPHFVTKKERRAKELVAQFEDLMEKGKLTKHLEKRRKKNAAKDRKRIGFD